MITFNEKFVGLSPHDSHLGPPPTCLGLHIARDLEVVGQIFLYFIVGLSYVRPIYVFAFEGILADRTFFLRIIGVTIT